MKKKDLVSTTIINIRSPIIPGYTYNATTGISNSAGIGYSYAFSTPSTTLLTGVDLAVCNTVSLPVGVYMISGTLSVASNTGGNNTIAYVYVKIGTSTSGNSAYGISRLGRSIIVSQPGNNVTQTIPISCVANITTAGPIYIWATGNAVSNSLQFVSTEQFVEATRIA